MALLVRGEREQVWVAEAPADRRGLTGGRGGGVEVPARLLLEDDRKQEVATLDAIRPLLIEQPLRATQPAACPPELAPTGKVDGDPERASEGGQRLDGP